MIVLDTHALIWWVNDDEQLSDRARKAIEREISSEDGQVFISTITAWEIALLVEKGRLTLTMDVKDWIDTVTAIEGVRFVPVDNEVAIHSEGLPGPFHPAPADRLIVALAGISAAAVDCYIVSRRYLSSTLAAVLTARLWMISKPWVFWVGTHRAVARLAVPAASTALPSEA